jgi:DNA-binding transcriptional MerR regulator
MRYLKTSEAAALLNVSPNTLRAWERRFGFPKPQRSPGKHRLFTHGEVAALRDALQEGLSISSAISRAREGLAADANSLVGALASYERERADAAIEAALALRTRSPAGTASTPPRGRSPRTGPPIGSVAPSG